MTQLWFSYHSPALASLIHSSWHPTFVVANQIVVQLRQTASGPRVRSWMPYDRAIRQCDIDRVMFYYVSRVSPGFFVSSQCSKNCAHSLRKSSFQSSDERIGSFVISRLCLPFVRDLTFVTSHFYNEADEVSSTVPCRSVLIGGIELECITRRFREHRGGQLDGCFLDVFWL